MLDGMDNGKIDSRSDLNSVIVRLGSLLLARGQDCNNVILADVRFDDDKVRTWELFRVDRLQDLSERILLFHHSPCRQFNGRWEAITKLLYKSILD